MARGRSLSASIDRISQTALTPHTRFSCDIFCRVVDNYGDIGVCWRLARQLHHEFSVGVRLIVDDLNSFQKLAPPLNPSLKQQTINSITIVQWSDSGSLTPADCVIEAFACALPNDYLQKMATRPPVWLNLEYLSAETWVEEHHQLPSLHPPLTKHFFFPGFSSKTGGVIREQDVIPAQLVERAPHETLKIFVFCYPNAALTSLLTAWNAGPHPVWCNLSAGLAEPTTTARTPRALTLDSQPFVPQEDFDTLLRAHHLCFVRGEDSFVRAQLAGLPFVWHIYPQAEGAHWIKIHAFLDRYCVGLDRDAAQALRDMWVAWNAEDTATIGEAWQAFSQLLPTLCKHARQWAETLTKMPDLATNLVTFYRENATI
ncbi:MAG: elongation factor P maturation arginine rhamnosyltransferase EarP [Betaproteobacteria bacterium]|nr:elongation factor P maturation arginine rhamnosyltransferase EarP [Betaproteobacteria bacterium]